MVYTNGGSFYFDSTKKKFLLRHLGIDCHVPIM